MAAEGNEAPATRRWQFSLRGILSFTAWAACTAAFARLRGTGAAVLIVGLSACALNCRGDLSNWQLPGRRGGKTAYLAWALLLASLFLPAVRGCSNSSIAGWQAAGACAMAQFSMPDPGIEHRWVAYGYYSMLNLANLLLLLSPWALYRARRGKGQCYAAALGICAVAVWSASVDDAGGLLAGYYVWSLAVLCLLSAFPLGPRTMTVMVLAGLGRLFLLPLIH
ncbi:MAG TPA: hypothetical protein VN699_00720 [Pirellulales bacterium]|nr:hypothetical protein [Pirellulales bacterium]